MIKFSGGCLCGEVRYEVSGEVLRTLNCHCDDCRKNTGAAFVTNIFINRADLTISQGKVRVFEHVSDAGNPKIKEFCPNCGSQLFGATRGRDTITVKAGSIDDADFVQPEANVFTSKALSFIHLSDDLKRIDAITSKRGKSRPAHK